MDLLVKINNHKVGLAREAGKISLYYDNWNLWRDLRKYCTVQGLKLDWDCDGSYDFLVLYNVDEGTDNFIKITFQHADLFDFFVKKK